MCNIILVVFRHICICTVSICVLPNKFILTGLMVRHLEGSGFFAEFIRYNFVYTKLIGCGRLW